MTHEVLFNRNDSGRLELLFVHAGHTSDGNKWRIVLSNPSKLNLSGLLSVMGLLYINYTCFLVTLPDESYRVSEYKIKCFHCRSMKSSLALIQTNAYKINDAISVKYSNKLQTLCHTAFLHIFFETTLCGVRVFVRSFWTIQDSEKVNLGKRYSFGSGNTLITQDIFRQSISSMSGHEESMSIWEVTNCM